MRFSRHFLPGFMALLAATSLTSCGFFSDDAEKGPEYIAVQVEEDGRWAFWNPEKGIVLADEFKSEPTAVYDGMFSVKNEDGTYALYAFDEKTPKPVKDCEELYSVGYCSEGLIPVVHVGERISVIEKSGKKLFTVDPIKGKEIEATSTGFYKGMLIVRNEEHKYGVIDKDGDVIIEPRFDDMFTFTSDLFVVAENKDADTSDSWKAWSVVNKKGEVAFKLKKGVTPVYSTDDGRLFARDENEHIVIFDKKGESTKCPTKVSRIADVGKDAYVFANEDGDEGVMSMDGEVIIRAKYDDISITDEGYVARQDEKLLFLDKEGEVVADEDDYTYFINIRNFGVIARAKKTYDVYSYKGEAFKDAEFHDYTSTASHLIQVRSDFVNIQDIAEKAGGLVKANGIATYTFGTAARVVVGGQPEDHPYSSTFDGTEKISGYRFNINVRYGFSANFANSDFDLSTYSFNYTWNPESKLISGLIRVNAEGLLGRPFLEKLIDVLTKNGLKRDGQIIENKAEKKEDKIFGYHFSGANSEVYIIVNNNKDNGIAEIYVFDKGASDMSYVRNSFNTLFSQSNDSPVEVAATEAEEVVDSAVASPY